jgi:hypothetical protein
MFEYTGIYASISMCTCTCACICAPLPLFSRSPSLSHAHTGSISLIRLSISPSLARPVPADAVAACGAGLRRSGSALRCRSAGLGLLAGVRAGGVALIPFFAARALSGAYLPCIKCCDAICPKLLRERHAMPKASARVYAGARHCRRTLHGDPHCAPTFLGVQLKFKDICML